MKRMRIEGMTCEGCNQTVAEALTGAGATDVRADFRTGEVTFEPGAASMDSRGLSSKLAIGWWAWRTRPGPQPVPITGVARSRGSGTTS